jgi:hypothetical protein
MFQGKGRQWKTKSRQYKKYSTKYLGAFASNLFNN